MKLAHRLIMHVMPPDVAEYVVGDLVERDVRGIRLWRETAVALWSMIDNPSTGGEIVSAFLGDLRHGARLLRRSPLFTIVCVLTLALGIGATTAIFAVVYPVMIEPLPYPDPDRLALVWERAKNGSSDNVGFPTYRDFASQARSIQYAAAIGSWQPIIETREGVEQANGSRVSWTYFRTLGVHPALGRDFSSDEDAPGKNLVVILSHGYWLRAFGGDSAIVGRTITIFGAPYRVVGVMGADFRNVLSPGVQIWRVLGYANQPFACRTCHHLRMVARFHPSVSPDAATTELNAIHARLAAAYPTEYASVGANVVPVKEQMTRPYRPALLAVAGAAILMLLIAVANVANLLLARSVRREEEFAVRTALGAGRVRLARQLLAEGLLLVTLGGVAGVSVAAVAIPALVNRLPAALPRLDEIRLAGAPLVVAAGLVVLMAGVIGITPLLGSRVRDIAGVMRAGRRSATGNRQVARSALVVAEVALALMLLVGCGLLARSMSGLLATTPGFDARNRLTLEINGFNPAYNVKAAVDDYHDRLLAAIRAVPGVVGVTITNQIPLAGNVDRNGVAALDKPLANPEDAPSADRYSVAEDFLKTMGIPIVAGRDFTGEEMRDTADFVALVSEGTARAIWGDESPIGKVIRIGGPTGKTRRIIGVTGDIRHDGLDAVVTRQLYLPERQWSGFDPLVVVVRSKSNPASVSAAVRRAITAVDPTQAIVRVATFDDLIAGSVAQRQLSLTLFVLFGATALLLAVAGIYGVLAGRVAERTREIGLRTALGASPGQIVRLVATQGARLAGLGLVLGLVGALALTRFLQSMLFGVGPHDVLTLAGVSVTLAAVTAVACVVPARRALRVEPTEALRSE